MLNKLRRRVSPFFMQLGQLKPILIGLLIVAFVILFAPTVAQFLDRATIIPRFIAELIFNKEIEIKKDDGTVNILLLGIAGGAHEGATLTDTVMLAHIDPHNNKILLISLPRDLWVPVLSSKINAAYEYGEVKRKGGGTTLAKATIADVLGVPVDYAFRLDFSGFVKIVDQLGGIDVTIDQAFDDLNYPIPEKENDLCGKTEDEVAVFEATAAASPTIIPLNEIFPCRVEHLHFEKGPMRMDGITALKFVRSRQALGEEGTDFARSRRQQKALIAVRDKVLSLGILLNPFKLIQLSQTLGKSIDTDIESSKYDDFVKLAQQMKGASIRTVVVDDQGLLAHPPVTAEYKNQWVLIPRIGNGDFSEIKEYVSCQIIASNSATLTDSCLTGR